MRSIIRAGLALAAIAALFAVLTGSAVAHQGARRGPSGPFHHHPGPPFPPPPFRSNHPVFVQADNVAGNQVIAYDQARDGSLTEVGAYPTGGLGGELEGSV